MTLPNYANNLLRSGFTSDDLSQVSDRLFDAIIAWGDEEAIMRRVSEHFEAGADHVCLQALTPIRLRSPATSGAGWRPPYSTSTEADPLCPPPATFASGGCDEVLP